MQNLQPGAAQMASDLKQACMTDKPEFLFVLLSP